MPRDHKLYLEDIVEAADRILRYTVGMDYDSFASDDKTQDAVVRNLAITVVDMTSGEGRDES